MVERAGVRGWWWVVAGLLAMLAPVVARGAEGKRPNVILIVADDLGFSDIGCYGSEISTPNIDRLAAGGLRLTQFYNNARCCPTRASLLTGLWSHQAGIGHMVVDEHAPAYRGFLNENCVTIAEVLKPAGYHPLMVGKWHVGEEHPHWPVDRGFEHYYGLVNGSNSYSRIDPTKTLARDNQKIDLPPGPFYLTDSFTENAVKYIDEYGKKPEPFFMYLAYTAPHWPLHAPAETIAKYRGKYAKGWDALRAARHEKQVALGIVEAKWEMTPRAAKSKPWESVDDQDLMDLKMAVYAAQVEKLDEGVGRVMAKLKEMGIEENTLVMFCADNGACAEAVNRGKAGAAAGTPDSFMSYGLPWANASNTPFRLYKHWDHEGGISSPFIAYWPGVIAPGQLNKKEVGHVVDLSATVYDVAGATYPKEYKGHAITPLVGLSLRPIFKTGHRAGHEAIYWEHEGNKALRKGDWKLVSKKAGAWELYNMAEDRTEVHDLSAKETEKVAELKGMWEAWAKECKVLEKGDGAAAGKKGKKR
jgi:arylsulfatase A-like enzyme